MEWSNLVLTVNGIDYPLDLNHIGTTADLENDSRTMMITAVPGMQQGFTLTGQVRMAWGTTVPSNSRISGQISFHERSGVVKVEWVGIQPGTTGESVVEEALGTTETTQNPASHGGGIRYFPEKDTPDSPPRNRIRVRVTLAKPKGEMRNLLMKIIDVDDPLENPCPDVVDPFDCYHYVIASGRSNIGGDNRDTGGEAGSATLPDDLVVVQVPANQNVVTHDFLFGADGNDVTVVLPPQPGNNWRVAVQSVPTGVTTSSLLSGIAENFLAWDPISAGNNEGNYSGLELANYGTDGFPDPQDTNAKVYSVPLCMKSPLLTVWRTVHIEMDSMRAPQAAETTVRGEIITIRSVTQQPGDRVSYVAYLTCHLRTGGVGGVCGVSDESRNLQWPGQNSGQGRFENGWIDIGIANNPPPTTPLFGNTDAALVAAKPQNPGKPFNLPFALAKPPAAAAGNILVFRQYEHPGGGGMRPTFMVDQVLLPGQFDGGTITVAGQNFAVFKNTINLVYLNVQNASLSFVLHDDDTDNVLPANPNMELLSTALYDAFVVMRQDVGEANQDIAFRPNTSIMELFEGMMPRPDHPWQSRNQNADEFWVTYVMLGFQPSEYEEAELPQGFVKRYDGDPNSEYYSPMFGATIFPSPPVYLGGGSYVFVEACRDLQLHVNLLHPALQYFYGQYNVGALVEDNIVHEVGHALSGSGIHVQAQGNQVGSGVTDAQSRYLPEYLNTIRQTSRPIPK